jgi:hypothetical protein
MARGRFARLVSPRGSYGSTQTGMSAARSCRFRVSDRATEASSPEPRNSSNNGGRTQFHELLHAFHLSHSVA